MTIVVNTKSYARDANATPNSVPYIGPANTITLKDRMQLKREAPKPTSVLSGVARAEGKLTRTFSLTGAKTALGDAITATNVNIPVGAAAADIDTILTDHAALVGSAEFKALVKSQVFPA